MENKVSKEVRDKGYTLFRNGRVKKEIETDKRIHFTVKGETEVHSVIYDKEKDRWSCDCRFFSLRQKTCSHIICSQLLMEK